MDFIARVIIGWYPQPDNEKVTITLSKFSDDYILSLARQFDLTLYSDYQRRIVDEASFALHPNVRYGRDVYILCQDNVSPQMLVTLSKIVEGYALHYELSFGVPTDVSFLREFPKEGGFGMPTYNPEDEEWEENEEDNA